MTHQSASKETICVFVFATWTSDSASDSSQTKKRYYQEHGPAALQYNDGCESSDCVKKVCGLDFSMNFNK